MEINSFFFQGEQLRVNFEEVTILHGFVTTQARYRSSEVSTASCRKPVQQLAQLDKVMHEQQQEATRARTEVSASIRLTPLQLVCKESVSQFTLAGVHSRIS